LPAGDEEKVYRALDAGDVETLRRYDSAELIRILGHGRPVEGGKTGEFTEQITDAFGRTTDVHFRVPKKTGSLGVLIVLHGIGGDGTQLKDLYKNFAADQGLLVVAPSAQKEPEKALNEDALTGPLSERFPHWWSYRDGNFVFTALAWLKKRYPIDENRVLLSGYSMGGFGAWNLGLRYPDRFAAIVPFAGGLSRFEYVRKSDDRMRPLIRNAHHLPLYFVHGTSDTTVPVTFDRRSRDLLKEYGYVFEYKEVPKGGHILDVREGSKIMNEIQAWLKDKRREAHPKEIRHYFIGDYCPQAYWVRVSEFAGRTAEVTAKIEHQTIEIESKGVRRLTLFLDETLLDLSKPVRVVSGSAVLSEGKVEPAADVVEESWRSREDRHLVYRAKIVVEIP